MMTNGESYVISFVAVYWLARLPLETEGIGCFVCSSINRSEPDCEDTFNNTGRFYEQDCKAGRKGRSGKFPGTGCIKLKARLDNYTVLVRDCTVDNGDTTSDTEMGRESHCWMVNQINFNDVDMTGCALACNTDGCNTASTFVLLRHFNILVVFALLAPFFLLSWRNIDANR